MLEVIERGEEVGSLTPMMMMFLRIDAIGIVRIEWQC